MRNQFVLSPFFLDQPLPAAERLASPEWIINKPDLHEDAQLARMSRVHRSLADIVAGAMQRGRRPVSVAGDCCTAIGVLAGLQRAGMNPILLWLDAHGDFNTWETSPSGFVGGMPLAMIVGRGEQTLMQAAAAQPLPEQNVILVNARDLDPEEREALRLSEVRHLTDMASVLRFLPPLQPLYVHLDVDVIDSQEAPEMLYPVKSGPSLKTLCGVAESLAKSGQVAAVSLTLWKMESEQDQDTERACMTLFQSLLGEG